MASVTDGDRLLRFFRFAARRHTGRQLLALQSNIRSFRPLRCIITSLCSISCISGLPKLCTTFATYLSTLKFCLIVWAVTLVLGFTIAYFLAFHIRTLTMQLVLALVCIIPFWTSDVIRMISWIPLLGRNGLVNKALLGLGLVSQPVEWLLYSDFAVTIAFIHLLTAFMIVPILNSMLRIDKSLIEAARDAGAKGWQVLAPCRRSRCRKPASPLVQSSSSPW